MTEQVKGILSDNLVKLILGFITALGTFSVVYFGFIKESKQFEVVDNQTVVVGLKGQLDWITGRLEIQEGKMETLTSLYAECGTLNTKLRIENEKLKLEYSLKGIFDNQKPYAEWTKSKDFILIDINDKCLEWFFEPYGLKRKDVIGYDDYKNWSKIDADQFRKEDIEVLKTGKEIYTRQTVTVRGKELKLIVVRYPVYKDGKITKLKGASFIVKQ